MLNGNCKIYKFDFGNLFKSITSHIFQFLANLGVMFFLGVIHMFIMSSFVNPIKNETLRTVIAIPVFIVFACIDLFFIVLTFLPKKIILTENAIKVQRNAIPQRDFSRGFNDYLLYSMIVSCKLYDGNISNGKNLPFVAFNWNNLVQVKDRYNECYYIPVKNADDFIAEVNKRINNVNNSSQS